MDDPVKTTDRMITDAEGITRKEGGMLGMVQHILSGRGSDEQKANNSHLIKNILDIFPESLRENLFNKISEAIDYEPVIGVMGKTGSGKSSLCNALFKGEVCAVSDVEACTRDVQELRISFGQRSLKIIDIPGVGENASRDKEYEQLYRQLLPKLDLILWVVKGDDRAFSDDESYNIVRLVETMIRALPHRAKSGAAAQLKDEYKTEEVKTEAKGGFSAVISSILDTVIDSTPLPQPIKEIARKCKDKVLQWADDLWDFFF